MKNGIALRGRRDNFTSVDARILHELGAALMDSRPIPQEVGSRVFAMESCSEADMAVVNNAASDLHTTLSAVLGQLNVPGIGSTEAIAAESAAIIGGLCAASPQAFLSRDLSFPRSGDKNTFVVAASGSPDYLGHRTNLLAAEAFDNRETRNAVLYTMAYNYSVARQDDFGETLWPTLTLPNDQVGFGIVVNRLTVHRGVTHSIDGKVVDFKKIDLMRAEADHTVLLKEKTRAYPIVRASSVDKFVKASLIAPYDFDNEGVVIKTAPYAIGAEIGVIGLSQTDAALQGGLANQTDTLDPAISIDKLYVKIGDDIVKLSVYGLPTANFTYAPQGQDKLRVLNFSSKAIQLNKASKRYDGTELTTLGTLKANSLTAILEVRASGEANTEFGSVQVFANRVALVKVFDEDGAVLAPTSSDYQDIATAVSAAQIVGYDLRAYKTNLNMRERGDFIDRTSFTQLYEVPLLSPITAQRPQNTDGQLDAGDFESLVQTTRFRLKNDAVTAVLAVVDRLKEHAASGLPAEVAPDTLGAARFHVKPTFFDAGVIDVKTLVNSLTSTNLPEDLASGIVNVLRDLAFRMYVDSEYQAASSALGYQGTPTVIAATDPATHRYLMLNGEPRTLSEKFNLRIVSTLDRRFRGKVFLTFGIFDENRNQAPNILNFGNLIWSPEAVLSASVPRGESMSRETIVQPRYLFVNHLPVASIVEFSNIPDLVSTKLPLYTYEVPGSAP